MMLQGKLYAAEISVAFILLLYEAKVFIGSRPPHCRCSMVILRHTALGRTPSNEWSARYRDLYLTTRNTPNRQILYKCHREASGVRPTP